VPVELTLAEAAQANARQLGRRKSAPYLRLFEDTAAAWIGPIRWVFVDALCTLVQRGGADYARLYLGMVDDMWRLEQVTQDPTLTITYARNLAELMAYDGAVRATGRLPRLLARLRRSPHDEWRLIRGYRDLVLRYLEVHYDLAVLMAESSQMLHGRGQERSASRAVMQRYLQYVVMPLIELDRSRGSASYRFAVDTARSMRTLIAADGSGIDEAIERARGAILNQT
jgi:hypothetical protein